MNLAPNARLLSALFLPVSLVFLAGCPVPDVRVSNQGGGNILTATTKVAGSQLTELTPDEIQIVGDTLASFVPDGTAVSLTDDQAAAITDFISANNVNSIDDAIALASNPQDVTLPDGFLQLFANIDPTTLINTTGGS